MNEIKEFKKEKKAKETEIKSLIIKSLSELESKYDVKLELKVLTSPYRFGKEDQKVFVSIKGEL